MCPLRYVLAMLTALALLYCLAVLAMDSSGGVGGGDSADARPSLLGSLGAARLSAVVARARRRSCWRFTVSFFTGELLMDIWRGDASGAADSCDPCAAAAADDAGAADDAADADAAGVAATAT